MRSKGKLATDFSYQTIRDDRVMLFQAGRHVATLAGKAAVQVLVKAERTDEEGLQLLIARATQNFKRGNEKATQIKRGRT